jgi:hypothetical protein
MAAVKMSFLPLVVSAHRETTDAGKIRQESENIDNQPGRIHASVEWRIISSPRTRVCADIFYLTDV